MRTIFSLIRFLFIFSIAANGQNVDSIYYDKNDQITTFKKCHYYRIARQDSNIVKVFDYHKSGRIKMSGGFKTFDFLEKTGPFNYYRKNKVSHFELYESSKYPDILSKYKNVLDNIAPQPDSLKLEIFLYKNQKIESIGYISECCYKFGQWFYFSKDNKLKETCTYFNNKLDGPFIYYPDNYIGMTGSYKNNKKDGQWKYYSREGKLILTEYYLNDKKLKEIR